MDIFLVVVKWWDAFQCKRIAGEVLHPVGADAPNGSEYRKTRRDLGTTIYGFVYAENGTRKTRGRNSRGGRKERREERDKPASLQRLQFAGSLEKLQSAAV
jgi:hypothetical protein